MDESVVELLAEGGDPEAQYLLGVLYGHGEGVPRDVVSQGSREGSLFCEL